MIVIDLQCATRIVYLFEAIYYFINPEKIW